MAFTGNFMCTSFKQELLVGGHNFTTGGDVFKIALYSSSAAFTAVTTDYTASNEVGATGSAPNPYVAGGGTLTNVTPTTSGTAAGGTAFLDFNDITFTGVTLTAAGALIYNTTEGGGTGTTNSVIILDFGPGDKTATAGDFQIIFPVADATQAIIRIA
jgi:hypothetical protein